MGILLFVVFKRIIVLKTIHWVYIFEDLKPNFTKIVQSMCSNLRLFLILDSSELFNAGNTEKLQTVKIQK